MQNKGRICSVEGCGRSANFKGKCGAHYRRAKRLKDGETSHSNLNSPIIERGRDLVVVFARVPPDVAEALDALGPSRYGAARSVLERWAARHPAKAA